MKKFVPLLSVIICLAVIPFYSFAWGNKGHAIVSEIAFSFLDNNAKQNVQKYLGAMTIEQAGNWMDNIRSDHNYDYMKTWHYLNLDKGAQYTASHDDNIINALNKALNELEHKGNLSDLDIKRNLLIVFHLTADLHMPLHVGYGDDKGGNSIHVTYLGHPSNLHRVWDSQIIESEKITTDDCLALYKRMSKNEVAGYKKINVEDWMKEPRSLLGDVYNLPPDNAIGQAYIDNNKKIVERQLLIAGIRLSAVLEHIFK